MTSLRRALAASDWPLSAYDRDRVPVRVLQFGTGMLLRALPAALLDAANRAGRRAGRIVAVQSTSRGVADAFNAQGGLFTLVERGSERGHIVDRATLIGSVSHALVADHDWAAVRAIARNPELRVIVSNVTEAGFRLDPADEQIAFDRKGSERQEAPASFPAKLADLLDARFCAAPDAPPLFVIPTELADDNGPRLRAMLLRLASRHQQRDAFTAWVDQNVRFCSSLVDRITTGMPAPPVRDELEERLGYRDALLTITEPYALWAIECEPAELRRVLPIDEVTESRGPSRVVLARDISDYRQRKIRLLNGAHTALAPLARLSGVRTVHEATQHPWLGSLLRRLLFDEIVPSMHAPAAEVTAFARAVVDRFSNDSLEHEWTTISTDQTPKMRLRVVPSIIGFSVHCSGAVPRVLALAFAAYLRFSRCEPGSSPTEGRGQWRGEAYTLRDAELPAIAAHWNRVAPTAGIRPLAPEVLERAAAQVLGDVSLWGADVAAVPGFLATVQRLLVLLDTSGVDAAVADVLGAKDGVVVAAVART